MRIVSRFVHDACGKSFIAELEHPDESPDILCVHCGKGYARQSSVHFGPVTPEQGEAFLRGDDLQGDWPEAIPG